MIKFPKQKFPWIALESFGRTEQLSIDTMKREKTLFQFNARFIAMVGDEFRRGLKTPGWKAPEDGDQTKRYVRALPPNWRRYARDYCSRQKATQIYEGLRVSGIRGHPFPPW